MAAIDCIDLNDVTVLKLKGSLTSDELPAVEEPFSTITHRPGARVVVDLSAVEMVTTPALSMFIAAANSIRNSGGKIVFTDSPPLVRDILKRLRLHSVLTTIPGLDDAINHVRQ